MYLPFIGISHRYITIYVTYEAVSIPHTYMAIYTFMYTFEYILINKVLINRYVVCKMLFEIVKFVFRLLILKHII